MGLLDKYYGEDEEVCVMLVDMLYYGAEAQKTVETDTNGLVTDGLDAKYVALRTTEDAVVTEVNTAAQGKVVNQLYAYSLGVEETVALQFTFYTASNPVYSDYVIKVTHGETVYEYTADEFELKQGRYIGVTFGKLLASAMRDTVTVELWKNGERVSAVYTASIAGTTSGLAAKYTDLAKAMMRYGDSAATYFA